MCEEREVSDAQVTSVRSESWSVAWVTCTLGRRPGSRPSRPSGTSGPSGGSVPAQPEAGSTALSGTSWSGAASESMAPSSGAGDNSGVTLEEQNVGYSSALQQ